jgi:D-alanine-D-alanine ligase
MKKKIAVITGGEASEVGIALKSAAVAFKYLDKSLFDVYLIVIKGSQWWYIENEKEISIIDKNDFSLSINNVKIFFDGVFIAIHGTPAEDGKLQGYFDMLKIPYNCCGVLTAALTFDKYKTKVFLSQYGIKTAKSVLGYKWQPIDEIYNRVINSLNFSVFVKPNKNGSSYGASKVNDVLKLKEAILLALEYDQEVIIEEFVKGREVTNGVFTIQGEIKALPITEILTTNEFFDYKAKYEGASKEVTPADIDYELTSKIQKTSSFIYSILDFKGMCRVDYIIKDDEFYMLEVNSIPGMSEESIIPQQAQAAGYDLTSFFTNSIIECLRKKD